MRTEQVAAVKERCDVVALIGAVVALRKVGSSYCGSCPFHTERTPSFYVFPNSGVWHCFGCHEGGDIITFFERYQGASFRDVVMMLAAQVGVTLEEEETSDAPRRIRKLEILQTAAMWFHQQLQVHPAALAARTYLSQQRGMTHESIDAWSIGYAPEGNWLMQHLIAAGYAVSEMEEVGLVRGNHPLFQRRIMFPIRDRAGHIIGFGGRADGDGKPKYLNTPQTALFDKSAVLFGLVPSRVRAAKRVVVVEGYIDTIIAQQSGCREAVAVLGSALTEQHIKILGKLCDTVILALDPDPAGNAATLRAITSVMRRGSTPLDIKVMMLPDGVDPDEVIRSEGVAAWNQRIADALPFMEFCLRQVVASSDFVTADGRARATHRLAAVVQMVRDPVARDIYTQRMAELLAVPVEVARVAVGRATRSMPAVPDHTGPDAVDTLVWQCLGALLVQPAALPVVRRVLSVADVVDACQREIYAALVGVTQPSRQVVDSLMESLDHEMVEQALAAVPQQVSQTVAYQMAIAAAARIRFLRLHVLREAVAVLLASSGIDEQRGPLLSQMEWLIAQGHDLERYMREIAP